MPELQTKQDEQTTVKDLEDRIRQVELMNEQLLRAHGELQNKLGVIESFLLQEPVATDPAIGGIQ